MSNPFIFYNEDLDVHVSVEAYRNPDNKDEFIIRGSLLNKSSNKGTYFATRVPLEDLNGQS